MPRSTSSHWFLDILTEAKYGALFVLWIAVVAGFGIGYFLLSFVAGNHSLTDLQLLPPWMRFLDSLYFSVVTATTVGYGDLTPHGISRIFAAVQSVIGFLIFAVFIAKLVSHKEEIVLHEIHKLAYDSNFARTREGLFIVRKDFDLILREIELHKSLSTDAKDRLIVALEELEVLLIAIPDFYKSDHHLYTIDAQREGLLLEAVQRTLRRLLHLLEAFHASLPDWKKEADLSRELHGALVVVEMTLSVWRSNSPHNHAAAFTGLMELQKKLTGVVEKAK